MLVQPHQPVCYGNAGAQPQCAFADFFDDLLALIQHHEYVTGIFNRGRVALQVAHVTIQIRMQFDVLHQER